MSGNADPPPAGADKMEVDEPSVQSDADKVRSAPSEHTLMPQIRAKRLAMLQKRQAQAQATTEPSTPVASTSTAPAPRPTATPAPAAKKPRPSPPASPAVSIANGASPAPKPRTPAGPPQPKDSFEDFEHALITNVFGVTLNVRIAG